MTKFFKLLFLSTLMLGSMISISSISWFCSWIGLEINLLSFITIMKTPNNKYSTESISKYFLTQAMASFVLLFAIILYTNSKEFNFDLNSVTSTFMSSAIFMKMGAAPLHFWFPEVASGISWNSNLILLTWQKIAPMILISYLDILPNLMILFIVSSSIMGSLMGMNQTCMRKIMSYSSINHMSWMISSTLCSMNTWLLYFMIYSLMNTVIIYTMKMWKINFISQINSIKNNSSKIVFMMNLLSLGGLPPFTGFVPKWITINQLSYNSMFFLTFVMIIFTLVTLFFYLRISFSTLTLFVNNSMILKPKNNLTSSVVVLTTLPILVSLALLLL
uniref:NADH-ubiquinone oxidoreductase chain 2 n=1 Tax=Xylosandrus germanus TaxID=429336 RepID=A0A343A4V0_XYLGE|nr:NADH dehydrogenase subunit 2 [Xylosandrus germanus]AOY39578.1 NADH dehydrogenase subunit 2 [Xylosandrus germanus]